MTSSAKPMSVKRAKDRLAMANIVVQVAQESGATAQILEPNSLMPKEVRVGIEAPGGLCVNVSFSGTTVTPEVFGLHWHMSLESKKRLNPGTFGGNVNPHHFQKATHYLRGIDSLCEKLRECLALAVSGKAYLPEPETAVVA